MIIDLPYQTQYTTWDEVFQSENGQQVGWARETVAITGTAGVVQIGTLVVVSADRKTATIPADYAALSAAGAGQIAIFAGKDLKFDVSTGFNPDILVLATGALTQDGTVVIDGRAGGAIGDAEIKFPAGTTAVQKQAIFTRLKAENGFKVLLQAVKG